MELTIKGKNLDIPEDVLAHVHRKIGRLSRHLTNISEAVVELTRERTKSQEQRLVVQVTINSSGTLLRAEERAPDAFTAINAVARTLDRQIERYKGRLYERGRTEPSAITIRKPTLPTGEAEEEVEPLKGKLVRVKTFVMKPMSVEEAAEQMELLGHSFFFFLNQDTNQFNVVYKRADGDYALIQPQAP